ncbi:IS3 family transposase [Streptomyces sp. NPDC006356]
MDAHRQVFGVKPICRVLTSHGLKITTSTNYAAENRTPNTRSVRDAELRTQISRVHTDNFNVFGVRKVWRQLHHEGLPAARCTVARLMRDLGLQVANEQLIKPHKSGTSPAVHFGKAAGGVQRG